MTQEEVAEKAGLTRNAVSAVERGTQSLDVHRLWKLADALGVSPTWLLFGPDSEVTAATPGGTDGAR
jgi:transcriptional regulator with XRE-family HTH domain